MNMSEQKPLRASDTVQTLNISIAVSPISATAAEGSLSVIKRIITAAIIIRLIVEVSMSFSFLPL